MNLSSLYTKLSNVGTGAVVKFADKRKIKLLNIASLVSIAWFVMPTIRILLGFDTAGCVIDYFVAIGSASTLYFNYRHQFKAARFVISFSNYIGMLSLSLLYGRFMGTHVVLFAWLICNFYFFDSKRVIAGFSMFIAVTFLGLEIFFHTKGSLIVEKGITLEYFAILIFITFFVVFAITNMYKKDNALYLNTIEETNEALEQMNEEIVLQNEILNQQKSFIEEQKQRIEISFNATRDSIRYALNIQRAILKNEQSVQAILQKSFIIYRPKDIVSGDFYWINVVNNKTIIVVVDCTGHGVPGAFMTIVANSLLNEIVLTNGITDPAQILLELDSKLLNTFQINIETLTPNINTVRDGMDVAICSIDGENVWFAGAKRPLYYLSNGVLYEEKGSRHAVGATLHSDKDFCSTAIALHPNMSFYLFSDGVSDQFDTQNKKRYSSRQFRSLLTAVGSYSLAKQKTEIMRSLYIWQGETQQTDDIVIVGFAT